MKTKKLKARAPLTQSDLKWYTPEEVFGKVSKDKTFQKAYREEMARIKLALGTEVELA
ncbi:MAG: hypothetical protein Q7R90_02615 [bacterium]|nr:hypothetical protein [bacterium]